MFQMVAMVAADEIVCPVELSPMGLEGWVQIDGQVKTARQHQEKLGQVRLAYRAVVPTKYAKGQDVSDTFLQLLMSREHPDYEDMSLPVSQPIAQTTLFEKCSAPREIRSNGESYYRAMTIYELGDEIARRAADAYMALAREVDTYV